MADFKVRIVVDGTNGWIVKAVTLPFVPVPGIELRFGDGDQTIVLEILASTFDVNDNYFDCDAAVVGTVKDEPLVSWEIARLLQVGFLDARSAE